MRFGATMVILLLLLAVVSAKRCLMPRPPLGTTRTLNKVRFYYDPQGDSCYPMRSDKIRFNQNQFDNHEDCAEECCKSKKCRVRCELKLAKGPKSFFRFSRTYYNNKTGGCHGFIWGGYTGNGNNFKSRKECRDTCFSDNARNMTSG